MLDFIRDYSIFSHMETMAAIHILYATYRHDLYRFILRMVHSPEETEDILHESFTRILSYGSRYGLHNSNPKSLLFTTARNLCLNHLKRSGLMEFVSIEPFTCSDRTYAGEEYDPAENLCRLLKVLQVFNSETAEVFAMRTLNGLSCSEIARLRSCSERTVRRKYASACAYIRAHCQAEEFLDVG